MGLRVVRFRSVIILVINKFHNRSSDYRPNRTPLSPITIINHKYYNFLESDWSINPPIGALIGHLHVIGHLQLEIVMLMINW